MRKLLDFKLQADEALHRQISTTNHPLTMEDLPPSVWLRLLLARCTKPVAARGN